MIAESNKRSILLMLLNLTKLILSNMILLKENINLNNFSKKKLKLKSLLQSIKLKKYFSLHSKSFLT